MKRIIQTQELAEEQETTILQAVQEILGEDSEVFEEFKQFMPSTYRKKPEDEVEDEEDDDDEEEDEDEEDEESSESEDSSVEAEEEPMPTLGRLTLMVSLEHHTEIITQLHR